MRYASLSRFAALLLSACAPPRAGTFGFCSAVDGGDPMSAPAAGEVTYARDLRPVIQARCVRCHQAGGIGPFGLESYEQVYVQRDAVAAAVETRHMPPWMPAPCCAEYEHDESLSEGERALFARWVAGGARAGDLSALAPAPEPPPPLSRADVTLRMPAPYRPRPPRGSTDDTRCFVIDWPLARDAYVTGMNVAPGNRAIVHHLILAMTSARDAESLRRMEGRDGQPGYPCPGGAAGVKVSQIIGGGLGGSDFPHGLGTRVGAGSAAVLQIHYSTRNDRSGLAQDQTEVQLRIDDEARPSKTLIVVNPMWLVGDAMLVKAGDPDAVYYYHYRPVPFTRGKHARIYGGEPHMHAFGSKFLMGIVHADGTRECILEIPRWHFGWEQSYWLKTPRELRPDDQVYVECHFDNSAANQAIVDGRPEAPRDIAWGGNNQDMCAGFMSFVEE